MKRKTIFVTIILMLLLSINIYGAEERITQEELENTSNMEVEEINRENAVMLLSTEEPTVVGTWDVSATEDDDVTATLYSDCTFIISGTGNMKDYGFNSNEVPYKDLKNEIKKIQILEGVTRIGSNTFLGCSSLTSIIIPKEVTSIGGDAFSGCSDLKSITIPKSVTSIGSSAFAGCKSLTQITIPEKVTSIGSYAFAGCESLESINILSEITEIDWYVFSKCSSLKEITIPESVTYIGTYAFNKCSSLTQIKIPSSVTIIGERIFYGCTSLTEIIVNTENKKYADNNGVLFNKQMDRLICYPAGKTEIEYIIDRSKLYRRLCF